jgi:hypothetical protein
MRKRVVELPDHPDCLNCGTELRGQYCGNCGQRARGRLISLWELLQDAFGDLFELDSRLWRTLIPLLARPGQLTRDYLEGRRARYMPPFRMYLVLSLVFFVVAFFDPRDDLALLFEPEHEPTVGEAAERDEHVREEVDEVLEELAAEGVITQEQAETARHGQDLHWTLFDSSDGAAIEIDVDPETGKCTLDEERYDKMPAWFKKRVTPARIIGACERFRNEGAKVLVDPLLDNIPVALIVLLPFMALVLKGLYPLSRRYFVEHLLFFVHFHSFFFLLLTLQILFSRVSGLVFIPDAIAALVMVAASFYIPVYLYKAMRMVYGQGHFMTTIKYLVLCAAYFVGASLTMLGALFFALISV